VVGGHGGKRQRTLDSRGFLEHIPSLGRYLAGIGVSVVDFDLKHAADGKTAIGGNWTVAESDPSCAHQANLLVSQGSGLHQTPRRDVLFAECKL
jgi:hypothetical protein